ncbi:MAG: hypothetical protein ACLQPD_31015 [Desulfomonilaceae bacterium]
MFVDKKIDDLIRAGWDAFENDFDAVALQNWKKQASSCLAALVGPDDASEKFFEDYVKQTEAVDVLAGKGILTAAKEQLAKNRCETKPPARGEKQRKKEEMKHVWTNTLETKRGRNCTRRLA